MVVNLDLPDSILMENFKQYLVTLREKTRTYCSVKKPYRRRAFDDWRRFGVLPFLDLRIWKREADVTIPNRVIADAIFPPGEGGEETVRKTTAPLVEKLLRSLHLLQAQAAQEILEREAARNPERNDH